MFKINWPWKPWAWLETDGSEIRCYMRDPDGHLIEVGQLVRRVDD